TEATLEFDAELSADLGQNPTQAAYDQIEYIRGFLGHAPIRAGLYPDSTVTHLQSEPIPGHQQLIHYHFSGTAVVAGKATSISVAYPLDLTKIYNPKCSADPHHTEPAGFYFEWNPLAAGCPQQKNHDYGWT